VSQDYSYVIESKRYDRAAEKDAVLDYIADEIAARGLKLKDFKSGFPNLSAKNFTAFRQGLRSAGSIERLAG